MMTEKDIQDSLAVAYKQFNEKPYTGFLPKGLVEKFKIALGSMPPRDHNFKTSLLKELISKRDDELNFMHVGVIVNIIFELPLERLDVNLEQALEYLSQLEEVRNEYNIKTAEFQKSMERKKAKLYEISGLASGGTSMKMVN